MNDYFPHIIHGQTNFLRLYLLFVNHSKFFKSHYSNYVIVMIILINSKHYSFNYPVHFDTSNRKLFQTKLHIRNHLMLISCTYFILELHHLISFSKFSKNNIFNLVSTIFFCILINTHPK
jgi:hypothetical protein